VDFTVANTPGAGARLLTRIAGGLPGMTVCERATQEADGQSALVRSSRWEIVRAASSNGSSMVSCITRALVRLACPLMFSAATI
jgi:hypothetical protein